MTKGDRDKRLEEIRKRVREKWEKKKKEKSKMVSPSPPPRYDEVYFEGVKWIDSL